MKTRCPPARFLGGWCGKTHRSPGPIEERNGQGKARLRDFRRAGSAFCAQSYFELVTGERNQTAFAIERMIP
jgi:hypothetical protein